MIPCCKATFFLHRKKKKEKKTQLPIDQRRKVRLKGHNVFALLQEKRNDLVSGSHDNYIIWYRSINMATER